MFCTNCGTGLPAEARFCFVCGAPAAGEVERRPVDAETPTCRIRLWRGYFKAEFYAEPVDAELGIVRQERSRAFGWRNDEPPPADREDVREAYDGLVARLVALGWEPVGRASPWYAQRFERRGESLQVVEDEPRKKKGRVNDVTEETG